MNEFKQYKRKGLSEMIPFKEFVGEDMSTISVSAQDKLLSNEEFEQGYIARNPKNHADMWYVSKKYFDENIEPTGIDPKGGACYHAEPASNNDCTKETCCQPENPQQSLPPFHFRLSEEQKELEEKIIELNNTYPLRKNSKIYFTIDERQKTLMRIQLKAMKLYKKCLIARIILLNQ